MAARVTTSNPNTIALFSKGKLIFLRFQQRKENERRRYKSNNLITFV
jgi:hypothetical protein